MILFVFISNAWGSVSGGINCFNYYLATACARVIKKNKKIKICCIAPDLNAKNQDEMKKEGIIPITLSQNTFESPEAVQIIFSSIKSQNKLRHYYPNNCNTFCIGHDIYTGNLSKQLAEKCGGWNIVFHHMDYQSYYLIGKPDVNRYKDKTTQQETVLLDADLVCAVGPMLLQSAQDIVRSNTRNTVIEVFPGLAEFDALPTYPNRFNPIVFGRIEKDNQPIKQIPLAIDSFAKAIEMDKITPIIGNNPTLFVIGYEANNSDKLTDEVKRLQENASQIAGSLCNIVPYPYTTDREALGKLLNSASVAMMLSLHEGFGLVGYEAIAAGIPLILSENTGLYMFLMREKLDHFVYKVKIEGSVDAEKYSQNDLYTVVKALRDIRQKEDVYKNKALELRDTLKSKKDKYSWEAVANNFIDNVLEKFEAELKKENIAFFRPDEVTKLCDNLNEGLYNNIDFAPSLENHVFIIKGGNSLVSLVACLHKKFSDKYAIFIYNVQNGESISSIYSDFLNNCGTFFGKKNDYKGAEFKYALGERIDNTILILDGFPTESIPEFECLFSLLNKQNYNFYIFVVFETNSPLKIQPYSNINKPKFQESVSKQTLISLDLTIEQKLIAKILSLCDKMGYSKKLINYICRGINYYCNERGYPTILKNAAKIENELETIGLIEEYSEFSYQNVKAYLPMMTSFDVDNKSYAIGLYQLGRFYARCYHLWRDRGAQLRWGYFSCKCFSCAAELDDEIKDEIKADYEMILTTMRKRAMDISDYGRYLNALQKFVDEYETPDNLWIWYILIHCASIYSPNKTVLDKVNNVLQTVFPDTDKEKRVGNNLYVQLIRLQAELEDELGVDCPLDKLLNRIHSLSEDNLSGTAWSQCFSTIVNLAIDQKNFSLAYEYLGKYSKMANRNDMYTKMISIALEVNLEIEKHNIGENVDLSPKISEIKQAYRIASNILRDYRAQGWVTGLWGECQILLKDENGEGNLRKSMKSRMLSGEKSKTYRTWLQRISKYTLQSNTRNLLNEEMIRTETQSV